jgi:beta-glucosidase
MRLSVGEKKTPRIAAASVLAGLLLIAGPATAQAPTAAPGMAHPQLWPRPGREVPLDPRIEARVTALLAAMSLEQKVGQLIQADIGSITPEDFLRYPLGAILNGGNSAPDRNTLAPPRRWLFLADRFYAAAMDPSHGRAPIPLIWGTDAVHGDNKIVGATIFPHNIGLGAARDPALVRKIGEATALEVRSTGLDWTFGPTLAVVQDVRWGRSYESYSADPQLVSQYAAAMVAGLQGEPGTRTFLDGSHVLATAKHFLGDGGTGGRDQGNNTGSEEALRDIHGAGYPAAVGAGVQSIMASFSSWQGVKMSGNQSLLTGVLKERMGFAGFVVGDWNSHADVPGCSRVSCAAAVNAGLDMFMAPDDWKALYENTLGQARTGAIPPARLDDAVRRILRVKLQAHLFEEGKPSSRPYAGHFEVLGSAAHRALARQAVRESLVLLKNQSHLLPLSPKTNILVAGDGADSIPKQSGGWTLTWQGTGTTNQDFPHGESIWAGIEHTVSAAGGHAQLSVQAEHSTRPDVAVVVFGENPYAEFQGDIPTLEYSPSSKADLQLMKRLKAEGIPVVAVFLSGRPLWASPEINAADAFVAAWLPGSEGGGIADVLFKTAQGKVRFDFHGKLPFAWPATPGPGEGRAPLFSLGYGLRYADDGNLAQLPEALGDNAVPQADSRVFFAAGRAGAGWRWSVREGEDELDLPQGTGSSSHGGLQMSAADRAAQEDARLLSFSGAGAKRAALKGSGIDLQREANGQLSLALDYRVDGRPTARVDLEIACGATCRGTVPIQEPLRAARAGEWQHLKVPLNCFAKTGADMSHVTSPFALATDGQLAVRVANIHLESGTDGLLPCGG